MIRVGHGYDVHRLVENRPLIIGGIRIEHSLGLLGHSDADVLVHAIMDSMLGAAALGDIGLHFPDTDSRFEGSSSIKLLKSVIEMLNQRCYAVGNIDCTIIAQEPKLRPYINSMMDTVADAIAESSKYEFGMDQLNIKATTEEGLGFSGRREGISAHCVCCLIRHE